MRTLSIPALFCCLLLAACGGATGGASPELDKADSRQVTELPGAIEIPVGLPVNHLLQLLGAADNTERADAGRELWRYFGKRAAFVYVANRNNTQTLVIGGYLASPASTAPAGLPLQLTIVIDAAKKVANFSFAQLTF